jgi:arabinofuranan 3-O-arabinosyltransferase
VSEIDVDGLRLDRVATMPDTFSRLATDLGGDGRVALAQTPLDVVMSRSRGTDLATDDEEARLLRDFTLPDDRQYRAYGLVRPGRGVTEAELDAIAGGDGQVTVTSSSRAFDLPELRGSQALDGDLTTAWVPGGASVGESLLVQAPPQQVDHVDVTQVASPGGTLTGWATKVRVEAGRSSAVEAVVGPGRTRIPVPPTRAGRLRLTVLATNSPGAVVRISEVGFGSAQVARDPGRAARECVTVGSLDGNPLQVRVLAQPVGTAPVLVGRCRDTDLALRAGPHELRGNASWVADLLVLRDERGEQVVTPGPVPEVSVSKGFGPRYTVHAAGSQEPWLLVVGQSHDPIWSARSDNGGLGDPLAVDGYANGWVVPAGRSGTIRAAVSTQTVSTAALVVSSLGILVLLVIACLPRRRPAGAPQQAPVAAVPRRPSEGVAWVAAAVLAGVGLGVWGLAAVAVLAAWHAVDRPKVRDVSVLAVVLLVAVPVVWVAGNWSRWGVVSTDLVLDNPWPHRVAGIGLLVLLVAVARSERPSVDAGEGEE